MNPETKDKITEGAAKATSWLESKGWAPALARITVAAVAGAIIGIATVLGLTGCTSAYTQTGADGSSTSWQGVIVLPVNPKSNK